MSDVLDTVVDPVTNTMTADEFAARIVAAWQQAASSIIETGRWLQRAKDELDHGEFGKLFDENNPKKLPFKARTAQRLMAIAGDPIIGNATHVSHLPPSWGTLYQLTKLPSRELELLLANGTVNAETERKEVDEIIRQVREQGLYRFDVLADALNTLIRFQAKWPAAEELASQLMGFEQDERPEVSELAELSPWLTALHGACAKIAADEEADEEADCDDNRE